MGIIFRYPYAINFSIQGGGGGFLIIPPINFSDMGGYLIFQMGIVIVNEVYHSPPPWGRYPLGSSTIID